MPSLSVNFFNVNRAAYIPIAKARGITPLSDNHRRLRVSLREVMNFFTPNIMGEVIKSLIKPRDFLIVGKSFGQSIIPLTVLSAKRSSISEL